MKNWLQEYFYYTRSERNGALILLLLILGCCLAPRFYPNLLPSTRADNCPSPPPKVVGVSNGSEGDQAAAEPPRLFFFDPNTAGQAELLALGLPPATVGTLLNYRNKGGQFRRKEDLQRVYGLAAEDYQRLAPYIRLEKSRPAPSPSSSATDKKPEAFPFDPNRANRQELLALGLPERTVAIWLNYRSKGGRFNTKEDLRKIYRLHAEDYERLAPYVRIAKVPEAAEPKPAPPESYDHPAPAPVDINQAGAEEWQRLHGIGPAYAGRILRFREALGGFSSVEQVAETYGLPDSTFQAVRPFLRSSPLYRPLFVNRMNAEELAAHPYLSRKQARVLCEFRRHHGSFSAAEDLIKIKVLTTKDVERLAPYLQFD